MTQYWWANNITTDKPSCLLTFVSKWFSNEIYWPLFWRDWHWRNRLKIVAPNRLLFFFFSYVCSNGWSTTFSSTFLELVEIYQTDFFQSHHETSIACGWLLVLWLFHPQSLPVCLPNARFPTYSFWPSMQSTCTIWLETEWCAPLLFFGRVLIHWLIFGSTWIYVRQILLIFGRALLAHRVF